MLVLLREEKSGFIKRQGLFDCHEFFVADESFRLQEGFEAVFSPFSPVAGAFEAAEGGVEIIEA